MKKLIKYKYARPGKDATVFDQWLVLDRPDAKVLLLESHHGRRLQAGTDTILDPGAPVVWFVFPGAWHDVGRFHLRDGTFTGWYTNICTPVEMKGNAWSSTDLLLDHWMSAMGVPQWLDEGEFAAAVNAGSVGPDTHTRVSAEQAHIDNAVARDNWPPPITRDMDLGQARRMLG